MAIGSLEAKKGRKPAGTDAWFWGQVGPNDEDDDLPLAWLNDLAVTPKPATPDSAEAEA